MLWDPSSVFRYPTSKTWHCCAWQVFRLRGSPKARRFEKRMVAKAVRRQEAGTIAESAAGALQAGDATDIEEDLEFVAAD